jgi:nicotinate-nucleotide pyrophosphorylase (carboxylating)
MGLYDMILIKDNHVALAGGVGEAIRRARAHRPELFLEVEVTGLKELEEALAERPDRVLLDNFDSETLDRALERLRACERESGKRPEVELSGNITPETAARFAREGVDFVSSGAITHSASALDMSLQMRPVRGLKGAQ